MKGTLRRTAAWILVGTMVAFGSGRAQAMLAPATMGAAASSVRAQDLQTVQTFLEQKEVSQHLAGMGLSSMEVNSRLSNLSDQELHHVATRIQQEQPGRDGGAFIVSILIIGILVLLFVYLLKRV